jgi:hypothetical protein
VQRGDALGELACGHVADDLDRAVPDIADTDPVELCAQDLAAVIEFDERSGSVLGCETWSPRENPLRSDGQTRGARSLSASEPSTTARRTPSHSSSRRHWFGYFVRMASARTVGA